MCDLGSEAKQFIDAQGKNQNPCLSCCAPYTEKYIDSARSEVLMYISLVA